MNPSVKPPADRSEQFAGLARLSLVAPKPRRIRELYAL